MTPIRIATRGSALARWQAEHVASLLGTPAELVIVETTGDRRQDVPIAELGDRGAFVKEVQVALLEGRADIAVHSAKDLPSDRPDGLVLAAFPERGDPRDALVGGRLEELPVGERVATGSVRRRAQLAAYRPDLTFANLRGNIDTRLRKAADFNAIVVAKAALDRLGRTDAIAEILESDVMLPQVAQGALAVECRSDDDTSRRAVEPIDHEPTRRAVEAERGFLGELGGGCDLPVAAFATVEGIRVTATGLLATLDGRVVLRRANTSEGDPAATGRTIARELLDEAGGRFLLDELRPSLT